MNPGRAARGRGALLATLLAALGSPAAAEGPGAETEGQEAARVREQAAEEDPITQQQEQARVEAETAPPEPAPAQPNEFDLYGSLRVRYRGEAGDSAFSDGGSRIGVQGRYQLLPRKWLFARAEAGFNLLDEFDALVNPGANGPDEGRGDTLFRRLLYLGYESPNLFLVFGKTWSVYYKVSSFTDRFAGTGGQASGTYNAGTDGGYTGTGRAEQALQSRLLVDFLPESWGIAPFSLNIQLQDRRPIPQVDGEHYGHAVGLSAMLATRANFSLGLAYNQAFVPDPDLPALQDVGIDGDARALALGARWFDDDWYLASVASRLYNHEATDEGNYFDAWGWEVYAQYRVRGNWWVTGGWNLLRPDADQDLAGDYRIRFGVLGLRYALKDFDRYVYANLRSEGSRNQDGSGPGNVLTVGVRWNF